MPVGRAGVAGDVDDVDLAPIKVELEDDTPVADTTTGTIGDTLEAHGVPRERISGEQIELEKESILRRLPLPRRRPRCLEPAGRRLGDGDDPPKTRPRSCF